MGRCTAGLLWVFAAAPLLAQEVREPLNLDSGSVVRLHWTVGREKARLLAPLEWDSTLVRYCRYPSPVCGESTLNPPRMRPVSELTRLEVRRGSRTGRGALIGAAFGTLGGLFVLYTQGLSEGPRSSTGQQVLMVTIIAATWSGLGALIGAASDNWAAAPERARARSPSADAGVVRPQLLLSSTDEEDKWSQDRASTLPLPRS